MLFHSGPNLKKFDKDFPVTFETNPDSEGLKAIETYLMEKFVKPAQAANAKTGWENKRQMFEEAGLKRTDLLEFAEFRNDIAEFNGKSVPGAWTIAKNSDPTKRLLYLHGGAFTVGSAISHRPITANLAQKLGCVVFTPNYRLMPEHTRLTCTQDCQIAYNWILENGPDGPLALNQFAMAGDSAGGNLCLSLLNWARDRGLRQVDTAFALSPTTDSTASSPSFKQNLEKDLMLQPLLRPLLKLPRWLLLLGMRKNYGMSPADPRISPIFDDLSGLPPTLVQVSSDEMLYHDSTRYVAKAQAEGSPAVLQSWSNMPHVFQIFDDVLPEAHQALDEAAKFMKSNGF